MALLIKDDQTGWATVALLLVVGIVLGVLAGSGVRTVLGARWGSVQAIGAADAGLQSRTAGAPDSLLAQALPGERDPFRSPPALRSAPQGAVRSRTPLATGVPVVRALLYDNVNPTVQIGIGGLTSGWLHAGDRFEGWTVAEITTTSVRITRDGESVVLPSS